MNTSTKVFKFGNFCPREAFVKIVLGEDFLAASQRKWLKSQAHFFRSIFKINSFFSSGNGSMPDVLEISPNLLLGKMKRLCAFFSITSWAFALSVGDSQQTTVPLHCPLLNLSQRALLPALMVFARKRRGADFI